MNKLKLFINESFDNIETFLTTSLDMGQYPRRTKPLMSLFQKLQKEFHKQLFEMEVVETQLQSSNQQMLTSLDMQKKSTDLMFTNSIKLESANSTSIAQINQTLTYSEQLKADISTLESSSQQLAQSTNDSKNIVLEQVQHIHEIISQIDTINTSSTSVSSSVEALSHSINDIASILESVQAFYKQTQLLALNASIESARAGEAGKGFAVVASEIRHLAEGSSASVEKIVEIMGDINNSITNVKETTQEEKATIQATVTTTSYIEKGLDLIKSSYIDVDSNLTLVQSLLNKNQKSVTSMDASLTETIDAYQVVEQEIVGLRHEIDQQKQHAKKIVTLKDNLTDLSASIHILTSRYPLDLISKNKKLLEGLVATTIDKLYLLCNKHPELSKISSSDHKKIIDQLISNDTTIEAAWTNSYSGEFIYSNPPAGIKNGSIRQWFQDSILDKTFVSDFYISGISKGPCVTVSIPLKDSSKKVIGVLGVDLRFESV